MAGDDARRDVRERHGGDERWADAIPEALLVPLIDAASEVLRSHEVDDVPKALRRLAGFDRRGLARSAARQQIRRGLEADSGFRHAAVEALLARSEVTHALDQWDPADAERRIDAAAARDDLALLVSALYAARPDGWQFGVGLACAMAQQRRSDRQRDEEVRARETRVASLEEAQSRADETRTRLEHQVKSLEDDLRAERKTRREREDRLHRVRDAAARERDRAVESAAAAEKARAAAESARDRLRERLAKLEGDLRSLRAAQREAAGGPTLGPEDLEVLEDAASLARRLTAGLEGVATTVRRHLPEGGGGSGSRRGAPKSRVAVPVPAGLTLQSAAGLEAALRSPDVALVVDGYNVSMRAWSDAAVAQQRERLVAALAGLGARTRASVTVVFDGADVGARPSRCPGVRVVFSPEGVEADAVVIREVQALALTVPVVVVSSDRWVQDGARAAGAGVVGSDVLLATLGA